MNVRVNGAGEDELACGVDDFSGGGRLAGISDPDDAAAAGTERGLLAVATPDEGAASNEAVKGLSPFFPGHAFISLGKGPIRGRAGCSRSLAWVGGKRRGEY
jgi:hypothetical protein